MPKIAELPDGTILEFPDNTAEEVIQRTVKRRLGVQGDATADPTEEIDRPSRFSELTRAGVGRGLAGVAGLPIDVVNAARGAGDFLRRKAFSFLGVPGESISPPAPPFPGGSTDVRSALENLTSPFAQPENVKEAALMGLLEGGVSGIPFGGPAARLMALSQSASEVAGKATEGRPAEPFARLLAGLGVPAAGAAASRFVKSLPGAAAGLQEANLARTGQRGEILSRRFSPEPGEADKLFKASRLQAGNLTVQPNATKQALLDLSEEAGSEFGKLTRMGPIMRTAEKVAAKQDISFRQFRLEQSSLGRIIRNLEETKGAALGAAKKIYGALWDDIDEALKIAPPGAASKLSEAISTFKQEEAAKLFKRMFTTSTSRRVGLRQLNADALLQKIDRNQGVFVKLIGPDGFDDLIQTIQPMAKIPLSDKSAQFGLNFVNAGSRLAGALAGGGAATVLGFEGAAPILSSMAGGAIVVDGMSALLATTGGRAFVRGLAEKGTPVAQIVNAAKLSGQFNLNIAKEKQKE